MTLQQSQFHVIARRPPAAIDTRALLRAYAGAAISVGSVVSAWGPMWFGVHAPQEPFGRAALVRVFGAILIGAGLSAAGFSCIDDRVERSRGVVWFAAAHAVVWFWVFTQGLAVWGPGAATNVSWLILAAALVLVTADPSTIPTAMARTPRRSPVGRLRSQYERQIRATARQEERNRLARDLHDSIKQQLFVIQTAGATAETRFDRDPEGAKTALVQVRSSARDALVEMDVMLDQLRASTLTTGGLVDALKKACEALGFRTGATVDFKVHRLPSDKALLPGTQDAILRIAQEALANIGRHARARHVTVSLGATGDDRAPLTLHIDDDGTGFDVDRAASGMGIANMRSRADEAGGILRIDSRPGEGTTLTFQAPFFVEAPINRRIWRIAFWSAVMTVSFALQTNWTMVLSALAAVAVIRNVLAYRTSQTGRTA